MDNQYCTKNKNWPHDYNVHVFYHIFTKVLVNSLKTKNFMMKGQNTNPI